MRQTTNRVVGSSHALLVSHDDSTEGRLIDEPSTFNLTFSGLRTPEAFCLSTLNHARGLSQSRHVSHGPPSDFENLRACAQLRETYT